MSGLLRRLAGPVAIVSLLWLVVGWWPSNRAAGQARSRIADAKQEQTALSRELAGAALLPSLATEIEERLGLLDVLVPQTVDMDQFVDHAAATAERAGVVLDQIAPTSFEDSTTLGSRLPRGVVGITVNLVTTGEYFGQLEFLDELVAQPRLVVIESIALTAEQFDSTALTLQTNARLFTTALLGGLDDLEPDESSVRASPSDAPDYLGGLGEDGEVD